MIFINTLVELFDECQIENIIAGLNFEPDKIIFIGFKKSMTAKRKADLERFIKLRGLKTRIEYEIVGRYSYPDIVKRLTYIIERNEGCAFDLTGGKELVLLAMGIIASTRNVPMFQFNIHENRLVKIANCDALPESDSVSLNLSDYFTLNGGCVMPKNQHEQWNLSDDFKTDIEKIWDVSTKNPALWNKYSRVFGSIENYGSINKDLYVECDLSLIEKLNISPSFNNTIIKQLIDNGLLKNCSVEDNYLSFQYKNRQVRRCLIKGGNILELYTYMVANEISDIELNYYNDINIGVYIDWDGVIHDIGDSAKDTRNEIDVMMMRGVNPVFISCKNGEVKKEALYELDTVANRFGGEYAKKVIVITESSQNGRGFDYIAQRAIDMNIKIIKDVNQMSKQEFAEALKTATK